MTKVGVVPTAITTGDAVVVVYDNGLLSGKEIETLAHCFNLPEWDDIDHGVRVVNFMTNGYPQKDGEQLMANCSPDVMAISINLPYCFEIAVKRSKREPERSVFAEYHQQLILCYLHEMCHLSPRVVGESRKQMDNTPVEEEEEAANEFALEQAYKLAKLFDIEQDHWSKSPFFCKKFNELLDCKVVEENTVWLNKQRHMVENGITFLIESETGHPTHQINTFKEYMHLQSEDDLDDPSWKHKTILNAGEPSYLEGLIRKMDPTTVEKVEREPLTTGGLDTEYGYDDMEEPEESYYSGDQNVVDSAPVFTPTPAPAQTAPITTPTYDAFPVAGNITQPPAEPVVGAEVKHFDDHGFDNARIGRILHGLYMKAYNHIFTECGRILNEDMGFRNPEGVCEKAIPLTEEEMLVVPTAESLDVNGRYSSNASTADGKLRGIIMKNTKLPAYKLHLNINGEKEVRLLLPQNPGKRNNAGEYTPRALQARSGSCIMYVIKELENRKNSFQMRIENGEVIAK